MRKDFALPGLAVAGGLAGFALRWWQLEAAYNPDTQLFLPGHPASWALVLLSGALALVFLLSTRFQRCPEDFLPAFRCPTDIHKALTAAAGFLFLGAGVLGLQEGMNQLALWRAFPGARLVTYPLALLLGAALCFPTGVGVLLLGRDACRGILSRSASALAPFAPLTGLIWLFTCHLGHGTDPVLMRYGWTLAAAALFTLAHYGSTGFLFGQRRPRCTAFCALLGISVGILSLGSRPRGLGSFSLSCRPTWYTILLTAAFTLSALAQVRALLHNLSDSAPDNIQ